MHGAGLDLKGRHRRRRLLGPGLGDVGLDRHLQGVVPAVVAALDLDDRLAPGEGAGRAQRVHRRLGARVGEAQLIEVEAALEALGGIGGRRRGGHEERAGLQRPADGGHHGGVEVPGEHRAEAHGQVEDLAAVDVGQPRAPRARDGDRVWVPVLERRGHAQGQDPERALVVRPGAGGRALEALPFRGQQRRDARAVQGGGRVGHDAIGGRVVLGPRGCRDGLGRGLSHCAPRCCGVRLVASRTPLCWLAG